MNNVEVAFKFLDNRRKATTRFKNIVCHLIFDVKFDLTRKDIYFDGGPLTQVPESVSYSSVVSRDLVIIMFLIVALNDLDINMCGTGNAYLNEETRKRLFFTAGSEWGSRKVCQVITICAL